MRSFKLFKLSPLIRKRKTTFYGNILCQKLLSEKTETVFSFKKQHQDNYFVKRGVKIMLVFKQNKNSRQMVLPWCIYDHRFIFPLDRNINNPNSGKRYYPFLYGGQTKIWLFLLVVVLSWWLLVK